MKQLGLILTILTFCGSAQNVNIVPNYSFEELHKCTIGYNYPDLKNWYNPNNESPDAFLYCMDSVIPNTIESAKRHSGLNRVGIIAYNENFNSSGIDYIANKFIDTLKQGVNYCFDFYAIPVKAVKYGIDRLGIYFGNEHQYYTSELIPQIPQLTTPAGVFINDTSKWSHFELIYTASGIETDILIGNFNTYANTNVQVIDLSSNTNKIVYIVIDDVSLHEMSLEIGNDTTICTGTEFTVGEQNLDTAFNGYYWYHNGTLFDSIVSQKNILFNAPDSFVVEKRLPCGSVFDTIRVNVSYDACFIKELTINEANIFTPNNDGINDVFEIELNGSKYLIKQFQIKNRWGLTVYEQNTDILTATNISDIQHSNKTVMLQWDGRTTSGVSVTDGVYYYFLEVENEKGELVQKNGYISLFR